MKRRFYDGIEGLEFKGKTQKKGWKCGKSAQKNMGYLQRLVVNGNYKSQGTCDSWSVAYDIPFLSQI